MRRALVLTDESAQHPFRASLPLHWREMRHELAEPRAPWRELLGREFPGREFLRQGARDVRGFLSAYVAFLVATIAFIM